MENPQAPQSLFPALIRRALLILAVGLAIVFLIGIFFPAAEQLPEDPAASIQMGGDTAPVPGNAVRSAE